MGNRLYAAAVILFWLVSMTWLVTERILPPFYGGVAPVTRVANQVEPVAWRIEMGGRPCGEAVLQAVKGDAGVREVHSLIELERIEAPKATPFWLKPMLKSLSELTFRVRTVTTFGPLGNLVAFRTRMQVDESQTPIRVSGRIHAGVLDLSVRMGDLTKRFEHPWPENATLGGEITPAARLLPLWQDRTWTQEVYSPFASPKEPLELIEARVTDRLRLTEGTQSADVWTVEYRATEKTGSTEEGRLRARLFVAEDGRVLKHEAFFLGSSMTFYRRDAEESAQLADELLELDRYATTYANRREPARGDDPTNPVTPDGATSAPETTHQPAEAL